MISTHDDNAAYFKSVRRKYKPYEKSVKALIKRFSFCIIE
ncbi:hypothetical protein Cst_c25430 [Thermoclostridium stercorarium subsp. stercorarium DSM 8532]|uniref:Uncharacterized protein n=1 Tax=Thermoclostridium stercorarium (strain ATCC 35414 / DSM 8532 / NCIMB 11754) TaxID=1121335 RepID=L7VMQ2_THES1|nr:hypothetical protein Cst_c25430 [Thermoclostridium stercorarium subsp. stercorarium DSM 8532]